ncbi:MAG: HAD family hydrolase [Kofleriaceae bacterium]|nr:HAD family hydrolase [Kofleriaceae bacterium]
MPKPLLILDLDETLLHASEEPLEHIEDLRVDRYWVYIRPGLTDFLLSCSQYFQLSVWSSARDDYVAELIEAVVAPVVPLEFVWARSRGTFRRDLVFDEYFYAKDLYKVKRRGYDLSQVLIVDDDPRKVAKNYGNAVYIPKFKGEPDDILSHLAPYLATLSSKPDFRRIEKRRWRLR